jgi:hypothetical protein
MRGSFQKSLFIVVFQKDLAEGVAAILWSGPVRHRLLTFQLTLILQAFAAIFVFPCSVSSATIRLHC